MGETSKKILTAAVLLVMGFAVGVVMMYCNYTLAPQAGPVGETAVRAGCRFYAGYPITPQNQVPEYLARKLPQVGGVFLQGESEVASINMVYGAAAGGTRSMISSASCGISLMSETIGWCISAELPVVICNFQRGGPGIGDIGPAQQDYNQATKAHANGGGRMIVVAPASLQETVDKLYGAFDLAERYRSPVYFLLDGISGGMMESVVLPEAKSEEWVRGRKKELQADWAINGKKGGRRREIVGGADAGLPLQTLNQKLERKYLEIEENEVEYETYLTEDAEYIVTAYGIAARFARAAVNILRGEGYRVGMIRPVNLYPFPWAAYDELDYSRVKGIVSTEMSIPPQFIADVRAAVKDRAPVWNYSTSGGVILETNEIVRTVLRMMGKEEA